MSGAVKEFMESDAFNYLGGKKNRLSEILETVNLDKDTGSKRKILRMLWYLAKWKMPFESVLAAIVYWGRASYSNAIFPVYSHDTIQTVLNLEELARPPFEKYDSEARKRAGCGRRLGHFFNIGYNKKIDLILLCMAVHLVELENSRYHRVDDHIHIQAVVRECLSVFIPLTEMLGTWRIRRRLLGHILSFPTVTKKRRKIRNERKAFIRDYRTVLRRIRKDLNAKMESPDFSGRVRRHINNPGTLYHRLKAGHSLRDVTKKIRLDIVVDNEASCYLALGMVHGIMHPDSSFPFKDLIALPKYNGYRALVTTVRYPPLKGTNKDLPVEIRIFSEEMRRVNEYGVIAGNFPDIGVIKNAWWVTDGHFKKDDIHVFSPIGEIFQMPKGSTALDFAYHVHSDIGNNCRRIWIYGEEVPLDTELKNGNLVDVEAEKGFEGATEKWFPYLTTSLAKRCLGRTIKSRRPAPQKGRKIFEKVLETETRLYRIPALSGSEVQSCLEQALAYHRYSSLSHFYHAIEKGRISAEKIVDRIITQRLSRFIADAGGPLDAAKYKIRFAKLDSCRVVPGMPIVGRIGAKGPGRPVLIIYGREWRIKCEKDDMPIPLKWNIGTGNRYSVKIHIEALSRTQLLRFLLRTIHDMGGEGLFVMACETEILQNDRENLRLTLSSPGYQPLERLEDKLNRLKTMGPIIAFEIKSLPFIEKTKRFKPYSLKNPYTSLPVSDQSVFKGRENEVETIAEKLGGGGNLVICYGPTRIGKTSLLQYIRNHVLAKDKFIPILVDLLSLEDKNCSGFWRRIASRMEESLYPSNRFRTGVGTFENQPPNEPFASFCKYACEIREKFVDDRILVIILDEFSVVYEEWHYEEAVLISRQIKSILQDERFHISFACCLQQRMMSHEAGRRFESGVFDIFTRGFPVKLGALDTVSAERLIREPVDRILKYDDGVVEEILGVTACHPYILQRILIRIVDELNSREAVVDGTNRLAVTRDVVETALQNELECGDIIFYDIWQKCNKVERWLLKLISLGGIKTGADNIFRQFHEKAGAGFYNVSRGEVIRSLNYLREEGHISESDSESGGSVYLIHIPLFGRWLQGVRLEE